MPEEIKTEPIELKDENVLGEESLKDLLNPPLEEEPISADGKSKEGDKPSGISVEDVRKLLAEEREKSEERFGELEQTLTFYKGRLAEQDEVRRAAPTEKKEEDVEEFTYDEEKLATGMAENAPRTLAQLVKDLGAHVEKKLRKELGQNVDGRLAQDQANRARATAYQQDVAGVEKEYGDYLKDKDFVKEADAEIEGIIRKRGGSSLRDYQPGDLENAAARVQLRWMKSGKIKGSVNGNGNGKTEDSPNISLREIRARVPNSDSIGNGNGHVASGPPKTIEQLFSNERDRKIARSVIKKQGVSEEAYVRQYNKAKMEDDSFDR